MQTFLPIDDFNESAKCLDRLRLGKQRVEAWQILDTLVGNSDGWKNHPAVKMWQGYEVALAQYGLAVCAEWRGRGYNDNMAPRITELYFEELEAGKLVYPWWFGNKSFHDSHKSALLYKEPRHYTKFDWPVMAKIDYVWPTKHLSPAINKTDVHEYQEVK